MIKINVTGEMVEAMSDLSPCPLTYEEMKRMLEAAARVVERDLNITDNLVGRHKPGEYNQIVKSNGCIEVTI